MPTSPTTGNHHSQLFSKFKVRYVLLLLLLFNLVFAVVYGTIAGLIPDIPQPDDPTFSHILYTFSFVSLSCFLWYTIHKSPIDPQHIRGELSLRQNWWSICGIAIALLLFSIGTGCLSFYLLSLIAPNYVESLLKSFAEESAQASSFSTIYQFWETINLVIVAPISEEFIFRGIMIHRLAAKWNVPTAVWVSSIIFGLLHPNPIGISVAGIVWALMYLKTKTLIVPILAHALNNSVAALMQLLAFLTETEGGLTESSEDISSLWTVGLLLIVISEPFIFRFIYRKFPSKNITLPYFANEAKAITAKN